MMGGPLATSGISEHRGAYEEYSLTQVDPSAPLSKWKPIAEEFSSEKDCDDYKAAQIKQISDPTWVSQSASKIIAQHPSMVGVDIRESHDILESARCVTASQISSH